MPILLLLFTECRCCSPGQTGVKVSTLVAVQVPAARDGQTFLPVRSRCRHQETDSWSECLVMQSVPSSHLEDLSDLA